jgi:hypothetical protein
MKNPELGAVPDWYVLIKAARYLGVKPWELQAQHPAWTLWALWSQDAEGLPIVRALLG